MAPHPGPPPGKRGEGVTRTVWLGLAVIVLLFLAIRTPVMYRQPGGEDEDAYAVPGLIVLRTGVPKLPHVPARNPASVFYRADEALFSEPPLYFYWQSMFYAVLPPQYGTARLSSAFAGILAIGLLFVLVREWTGDGTAALCSASLYSLSRCFYFAATRARPDILCAALGMAALLATWRWSTTGRIRWLGGAGVLIGLGVLTHPFAAVYALQIAGWVFIAARREWKIQSVVFTTVVAVAVTMLWLPYITAHQDAFVTQFTNQFLRGHSEGLLHRLLLPWESIGFHLRTIVGHWGWLQIVPAAAALIACTFTRRGTVPPAVRRLCWLTWSALYLTAALVGRHHMVLGYWVYMAAPAYGVLGYSVAALGRRLARQTSRNTVHADSLRRATLSWQAAIAAGLLITMLPGAGLRTLLVHLRHWNDINYDANRFADRLLSELPSDAVTVVGPEYLLNFVAADRPVLYAQVIDSYFRAQDYRYDVAIMSRNGLQYDMAEALEGELVRSAGVRDDPFACYIEVHVPNAERKTRLEQSPALELHDLP